MNDGFCECGCGGKTNIAPANKAGAGHVKGVPFRYIRGHQKRLANPRSYVHRAPTNGGSRREHVMVAERALGKRLPPGAVVHHVNEVKSNNAPTNLVVCQDRAYHNLLHRRMRAVAASGNPNWRLCRFCGRHDDPQNLSIIAGPRQDQVYHRACKAADMMRRRKQVT